MVRWWVVAFFGVVGCSDPEATSQTSPPPGQGGSGGGASCPPGEETLEDGSCLPAGIPEGACGDGFESDTTGSCRAVLPAEPCGAGEMAVPGETRCRPVAPCGSGTWGTIPTDGTTQFVDGAYSGTDSDGTEERPWTTIQAGIDAAEADAVVAIAEGSYAEDIQIAGTPVRLWGRCPAMVEIVGAALVTVLVGPGADGAELRDLAVRGEQNGIAITGADEVLLDRVWVHDLGGRGVAVQDDLGPASATARGVLIEDVHRYGAQVIAASLTLAESIVRNTQPDTQPFGLGVIVDTRGELTLRGAVVEKSVAVGVFVEDGALTVESSLVRDTGVDPEGAVGRGVEFHGIEDLSGRLPLTWKHSLVERSHGAGIVLAAADATFEGLVVRETIDAASEGRGRAIEIHDVAESPSRATLTRSVLEDNRDGLNVVASEVTLQGCLVRNHSPNRDGLFGRGVTMACSESGAVRGTLSIRDSIVEKNHEGGVFGFGSDLVVEHSAVRDTVPGPTEPESGIGMAIYNDPLSGLRGALSVLDCAIERNTSAGLLSMASDLTVERSVVRETRPATNGLKGRGLHAQQEIVADVEPSMVTVRETTIEQSAEFGVLINASNAILEDVVVRGVSADAHGRYGDGIAVVGIVAMPGAGTLELRRSRVEHATRAGVVAFGGSVRMVDTALECNGFHLDGEEFYGSNFAIQDEGGNVCGCQGETETCTVLTTMLEAPEPL